MTNIKEIIVTLFRSLFSNNNVQGGKSGSGQIERSVKEKAQLIGQLTFCVIKADGVTKQSELSYLDTGINTINLGKLTEQFWLGYRSCEQIGITLTKLKKIVNKIASQLVKEDYSYRKTLLKFLYQIAVSDARLDKEEVVILKNIQRGLEINDCDFSKIESESLRHLNEDRKNLRLNDRKASRSDIHIAKAVLTLELQQILKILDPEHELVQYIEERLQQINRSFGELEKFTPKV